MAKFTFPIPGRSKKTAAATTSTEPMSKAQRILGSTHLSIDSKKQWDNTSNSGISVSVSESTASATNSSGRNRPRKEWGDDSEVMPERLLRVNEEDGAYSDYTGALREQPSSSTIKSWYDRTTQPLSVSQQTSASAMAKGPPSKAQRLLDMDNKHTPATNKDKKKPAMLDLSSTKSGKKDWDGPVLGNDYVTRSPSILSPLTPGGSGKRPRRRIQKRSTHESLRKQQEQEERSRPGTGGSQKQPDSGRHDDLPSLYKHYEQMSFAQMMDEEDEVKEVLKPDKYSEPQSDRLADVKEDGPAAVFQQQPYRREEDVQGPLNSHPTIVSHSTNSSRSTQRTHPTPLSHPTYGLNYPTQVVHAPTPTKMEHSPSDYAASVSSRHTRTSKASKRTEKSFQTADLQEKSVLMLSSDSEEDDEDDAYDESRDTISAAPTPRRSSVTETPADSHGTMLDDSNSLSTRNSNLTATNRMSSAPAGFLTIPTHLGSKTPSPVSTPSTGNLRESTQWGPQTFHIPPSPSDASLSTTVSSASTTMTWQEREGYGVQEARAVTMVPAQGPDDVVEEEATDSDLEYENPQSVVRESQLPPAANTAEPTPPMSPLSPSSMEFYIQTPQPLAMDGGHEHMMGLTRQEQMLIQALRQRRETMRQSSAPAPAESSQRRTSQRGHRSNPSEATITESTFNFGFPAPPSNKNDASSTAQSSMVDLPIPGNKEDDNPDRSSSCTADGTMFVLSPPPTHHKTKSITNSIRESRSTGSIRRSVQQPPPTTGVSRDDAMQAPLERTRSKRASPRDSLMIPKPRASLRRQRLPSEREREREQNGTPERPTPQGKQFEHWPITEEEPAPLPLPQRSQKQYHSVTPEQHPIRQSSLRKPQHRSPPRRQEDHFDVQSYNQTPARGNAHVDQDAGIPRPDSPISPMAEAFPAVPTKRRTQLNQGARLSAFGPPQGEFGWWGDED